jgi:hypothetical protein
VESFPHSEGNVSIPSTCGPGQALGSRHPGNEERLRELGAEEFESVMEPWLEAYIPKPNEAIPGRDELRIREASGARSDRACRAGQGTGALLDFWPLGPPQFLDFIDFIDQ